MSKAGSSGTAGEKETEHLSTDQGQHLLTTKFFVPPIRSIQVDRPRLTDLVNEGLNRSLILVSAPAGYGKTTLVSSWLKESSIPFVWLSLDGGDNDPNRFLQYLLGALQPIAPGININRSGMLQGMQPAQFENLINQLANELALVTTPFFLVLDDFHVIQSESVMEILSYLLEHLPTQMHLALLTRTDPPLPLSRLRVRGQLLDVRADQLRFTQAEIAAFLNETMGLTLSASDLSAMETRTEGWIAGLQLAALSMQNCKDIHGFVCAFTGSHHYVMDYLIEEVLRNQPKNVSIFLLQTSILERLSGALCQTVVNLDSDEPINSQEMLEALEDMNLFTIPLDDEQHWYRYHHLFADVLKKRLGNQYPQLVPELHRRASRWYEQNGFLAEAIQHAILAGDQDRAAQLIEDNGCFLLMSGEVATLLNWTDAIEFQSETRPWLAIQKAWALALIGDLNRIEPTLQIPEKLLTPLEPTLEVRTMQGTIAAARAQCANSRGNSQLAAQFAQVALQLLPSCSSISQSIRSVATSILGDASLINGNFEEAIHAYTEAIQIGRAANNLNLVIIASTNIAEILWQQGQLHQAADTYTQSLQIAVRPDGQRSPLAAKVFAGLAKLSYEWNRLDEAEQYLLQCLDVSQTWGDIGQQAYAYALLARLEQARNNLEKTRDAIRAAERLIDKSPLSPHWSIQVRFDLMRVWLAQGNLEKPSQRVQKRGLSIDDEIPYQRGSEYIILLRLLIAQGDFEDGITLANRLLQQTESTGQMSMTIEILVIKALAFQAKKDTEQSLVSLERALALGQHEGYLRVFLDEGEAMTRLLCLVQSRCMEVSYAANLLSTIGKTSGMTPPSMQLMVEPLTSRELELLKLIETGHSNEEIAGKLFISIPTVKRHISNIYAKLGVKSRTQAIAIGKELNLFE